jgi:hypothetical protein
MLLLVYYEFVIEIQAVFIMYVIENVLGSIFINISDHDHASLVHLPSSLELSLSLCVTAASIGIHSLRIQSLPKRIAEYRILI